MQLYVPAARGSYREVLSRHHDDPIVGHFVVKCTLKLVARMYYWLDMARRVKAYTQAYLTCELVRPMQHRLHKTMEPLPESRGPLTDNLVCFTVGLPVSCRKRHAKPHNAILIIGD
jgi:spore maturation protein SpmA